MKCHLVLQKISDVVNAFSRVRGQPKKASKSSVMSTPCNADTSTTAGPIERFLFLWLLDNNMMDNFPDNVSHCQGWHDQVPILLQFSIQKKVMNIANNVKSLVFQSLHNLEYLVPIETKLFDDKTKKLIVKEFQIFAKYLRYFSFTFQPIPKLQGVTDYLKLKSQK